MRVTRIIAAAVLLLLATLLPGPAHADWSRPAPLESADWLASEASVAVAGNGVSVVAWVGQHDGGSWIRYRRIGRTGALGPIQTLAGAEPSTVGGQVRVAVDDDGDALFTWIRRDPMDRIWQVMAQRVYRDGSVGPEVLLSGPTLSAWIPQAALTPDGDGAVVFDETDPDMDTSHQVLVRISSDGLAGRRWTLPVAPAAAPLQVTRAGDFVTLGLNEGRVVGYRLLPNDRLRSRAISIRSSGRATLATMGIGRKGVAYVAYVAGRDGYPTRLWARRWERDGALTRVRRVSPAGQATGTVSAAVDKDGDMVIAWPGSRVPGGKVVAYSRVWRQDGSVGPTRRLGNSTGWEAPYYQFPPLVAVDADGDGVLVWASEDAEGSDTTWARQIKRRGEVGQRFVMAADAWPAFAAYTPQGRGRVGVASNAGISLRTGP